MLEDKLIINDAQTEFIIIGSPLQLSKLINDIRFKSVWLCHYTVITSMQLRLLVWLKIHNEQAIY